MFSSHRSLWMALCLGFGFIGFSKAEDEASSGKEIYIRHCAECHGDDGQGVKDQYEEPLRGNRSLPSLTRYIDRYMPEDEPELLDAAQSKQVAEYIAGAFYSQGTQTKQKMAFARLTNRQFRESVADLIGSFGPVSSPGEGRGLKAQYFESDGMDRYAKKIFERDDEKIDFDFAEKSPGDGIKAEQFAITWEGSLIAPATGWYEFRISTPNGARVYLNHEKEIAFIDAWVSSGSEIRQVKSRIFLLGGRSYPLKVEYFKYKETHGMVRLDWKPPQGEWQVVAAPYLSPNWAGAVAVVSTAFPPDDASEGYERGTGISKSWHEATTAAAIEAANQVIDRFEKLSAVKEDDPQQLEKLKKFVTDFAERAFRRPLDENLRQRYVDGIFMDGVEPEKAVKRAVILILQSPRFLYPELEKQRDDFTVAARLALGIYDSLPDAELMDAAEKGQLRTQEQVAAQAWRLMSDPRAKAKLEGFFEHWLKLDIEADLQKDIQKFPGFDAMFVGDLRRSLEIFVHEIVWSEKSDYRQLIQADYLWLNERLAKFYQIPMPAGGGFQKVSLDSDQRSGVITHPYLLSRLAHHDGTSPIHRGVFVTRNLLGGILRPPPQAIEFQDAHLDPKLSMREKVAAITRDTSCMTCHETINPLGFSLENFDAVGRFRLTENERPIISESDFETFEGEKIRLRGPRDLAEHAIQSGTARRGFIRHIFQATIKQNPNSYGVEVLDQLEEKFIHSGYHIRQLVVDIHTLAALDGINSVEPAKP